MIKNNLFLLLLLASSSAYGMGKYEQLKDDDTDDQGFETAHEAKGYSSENLVEDELAALEVGQPTNADIGSDLLLKALRHNVFRTSEQREKLEKMAKDSPPAFQLLAQLFNQNLPTRGPGAPSEVFTKTPAFVRTAASIRLDKDSQAALQATLAKYKLEKDYEQLRAWLDTSHVENNDLRNQLAQALADKKSYKKKAARYKRQLEKMGGVDKED